MNNNCVYCDKEENGDPSDIWGWFSTNEDGYKVCPDCEAKFGLDETVSDEMYSYKQQVKQVMSNLGKKSWQSRKGKQDMSAIAKLPRKRIK